VNVIILTFEIDDEELKEFLERDDVGGGLYEWAYGELCQNQGFGFLTGVQVSKKQTT